jgi:hypothetical protein
MEPDENELDHPLPEDPFPEQMVQKRSPDI